MTKRKKSSHDPEDVFVDALTQMEPSFLACRETAHTWKISSPYRLVDTEREDAEPRGGHAVYAERKLTCQRCGMVRSDAYAISTRHGHTSLSKISSRYDAPDGYAISGIGSTRGMRDLLLGMSFDLDQQATAKRRTTRRRKKAA